MSVLLDYLDWRGDLSFQVDPVNEADYYLISKIGCPDLTGLVPSDAQEVPLPEVVASFRAQTGNQDVSLGVSQSPQVMESFYRLPSVPRFQPLMLSGFRRKEKSIGVNLCNSLFPTGRKNSMKLIILLRQKMRNGGAKSIVNGGRQKRYWRF